MTRSSAQPPFPPAYEEYRANIVYRTERFYVTEIVHRQGELKQVWYELVYFPGAVITVREAEQPD